MLGPGCGKPDLCSGEDRDLSCCRDSPEELQQDLCLQPQAPGIRSPPGCLGTQQQPGPGTPQPEPRDPKRHHGPGAPTAGETQTLPKARQWCLRGGEGLEALPKALHEHGDDESSENTLRSLSQPLIFSAWHFVPFKLKQKSCKKAQPSTAELRLRQSWGCPQPRGTKPQWQQHFQGHLS